MRKPATATPSIPSIPSIPSAPAKPAASAKPSEPSEHLKETINYCNGILSGEIPSGMYAKKAVKRFASDLKRRKDDGFAYDFRPELAEDAITLAETLVIPDISTEDKKLKLLGWHKFIYYNLYGWVHKSDAGRRRFRSGYVEVARKNSKTTSLLFPIILYDFLTTDSAESYFVSQDAHQSYKAFVELKHIIKADKDLKAAINDTVSAITYRHSRIAFFSSESVGIDSYKNSCSVIDEFHSYENDRVVTAFRYGGRARKNNLVLVITSAGLNISGPCYTENEKARKMLNGVLSDDTYFAIIYAYDEKDDWKDKKNFIKANPSLGVIIKPETLENDLQDAMITPSHQSDFKAKTCGIWTNDSTNWISLQQWDTDRRNTAASADAFRDAQCYAALDLSSVSDFTAYTKCFKKDGFYYLFHKFYVPSEKMAEKYKVENINIRDWAEKGVVTAIPGPTIDYNYILDDITRDAENFRMAELAYDRWNSGRLVDLLDEKIGGVTFIEYDQSLRRMSGPSKEFERLVLDDKIIDGNPVMKWMVCNAEIRPDINNNYKPLKAYKSSTARIDGVVTTIMAIDRCRENEGSAPVGDFDAVLRLF
jgi:phage terminase large subunit-like protein